MKRNELAAQQCLIARSVAVVGDRWTLMILRDCFRQVTRFDEFQSRLGISRTIIAHRLHGLVSEGVLEKRKYCDRPPRYEYVLTDKGKALYPVIIGLFHWGETFCPGPDGPPFTLRHSGCGHHFTPRQVCAECGEQVGPGDLVRAYPVNADDPVALATAATGRGR